MSEGYRGLTIPSYADAADNPAAFKDLIDSGPIPRFADASARDAALTSPTEGEHCYLLSSSKLQVYNGATWEEPYLPLAGGTLTGQLNMSTNKIINVDDPTVNGDAMNLGYADANYSDIAHSHGASGLDGLSDVTITSAVNLHVLQYNGSIWVNRTIAAAGLAAASHSHTEGDLPNATTSAQGVVQLSSSQTGSSTTLAPTESAHNQKLKAHTGTGSEVLVSTSAPSGGQDGDIWLRY